MDSIEITSTKNNIPEFEFGALKIFIIGCGDSGNSVINHLSANGLTGAVTIGINNDKKNLDKVRADVKISEYSSKNLREMVSGADFMFIIADLNDPIGSETVSTVSEIVRETGVFVVSILNSVVFLDHKQLGKIFPCPPDIQVQVATDQLFADMIDDIVWSITQPQLISNDVENIKVLMKNGGLSTIMVGEAKGNIRSKEIVEIMLSNTLPDVDISSATACLFLFSGGDDLCISEVEQIEKSLLPEFDHVARILVSARVKKDYGDRIRCIAIITGLKNTNCDSIVVL